MKYIDEYRQIEAVQQFIGLIHEVAGSRLMTFMEVCGTHTMAIARSGIRQLLPETLSLISGPGCPVCVTPNRLIDRAVALSRRRDVLLATFGDMMKVPGSTSSLDREHAAGRDVRVVASTLEALELARQNPSKNVVFIGVGFETTAPTVAASILEAENQGIDNYKVLSAHKVMPPAMRALCAGELNLDGFLCPGHVSTIIGSKPYVFLAREFQMPCVIAGFEPLDIVQAVFMLARQVRQDTPSVEIQYTRAVRPEGNPQALKIVDRVFEPCESEWRGIGIIPESGLRIRDVFAGRDAESISVDVEPFRETRGCLCGRVLQGLAVPPDCPLFGKACTPDEPIGPCMVSSEGSCAAYYKYQWQPA
ncbi:MAG TPA: hydrogenase formation protein HypD [bacterium]|nr:hydrogenase formation protein HypD [bacterium]